MHSTCTKLTDDPCLGTTEARVWAPRLRTSEVIHGGHSVFKREKWEGEMQEGLCAGWSACYLFWVMSLNFKKMPLEFKVLSQISAFVLFLNFFNLNSINIM